MKRIIQSKNESEQQYLIKFFIELTECNINESKIRPFQEYKEEFSKIKQKKLLNAIKFAEKFSLGEITFKQHVKFIKDGLKLYEDQCAKLEEIKKEKESLNSITNKSNEILTNYNGDNIKKENNVNETNIPNEDTKKKKTYEGKYNTTCKFLGIKRNLNHSNKLENNLNPSPNSNYSNNYYSNALKNHMTLDLIYSIDDFIFNKRDYKLNDYDVFFMQIQEKIINNKLNPNSLHVRNKY